MKQYLPHTALAVLLGVACVAVQAKSFKCLSSNRLDCSTAATDLGTNTPSGTSDVETTTTFREGRKRDNGPKAPPVETWGGGVYAPAPTPITTPVPEPETYAMMALGAGVVAWSLRRRRKG